MGESPQWAKESARPPWWPSSIPWKNVKTDNRCAEEKAHKTWTEALRDIVHKCYEYYGQEDMLT